MEISKKKIKNDVLKMLDESGIAKESWGKILNKFVNYSYILGKGYGNHIPLSKDNGLQLYEKLPEG